MEVDEVPRTTDWLAKISTAVIVGIFDGYGAAQWNTRTGERPSASDDFGVDIFRPVEITPVTVLRGAASMLTGARVEGGVIGCDSDRYSNEATLKVGAGYVFSIVPEWDPAHARSLDPWVIWAWPINPEGMVQTPSEGNVPISRLNRVLATTPLQVLPTPTASTPR